MSKEKPDLHDEIAKLCLEHFNTLPKRGKPNTNEWTILSCIVQENNSGKLDIVALGTGTKCIGQDKMSKDGDILNDSHAEVICRRAFLKYLYLNMLSEESNLLKFHSEKQKFSLENGLKFHFFTTHVPCGDAAIFEKQDTDYFGEVLVNNTENAVTQGEESNDVFKGTEQKRIKLDHTATKDIYRTGAKCLATDVKQDLKLPGMDYHITGVVRTKPGRGFQTLSVSCSDKFAKWSHLGIQGGLLSILIDKPVYLNSITVVGGTLYNKEAMQRAFFNRLGNVNLEDPYCRTKMVINQSSLIFAFAKTPGKIPCPSSIIWVKMYGMICRQTEVAVDGRRQGVTKKQIKTAGALTISKRELYKYFHQVIVKFKIDLGNIEELVYKDVKLLSKQYQTAWAMLKKYFKVWSIKDNNLLSFTIE